MYPIKAGEGLRAGCGMTEGDNGSNCRFLGDGKLMFGYIPNYSSPIV